MTARRIDSQAYYIRSTAKMAEWGTVYLREFQHGTDKDPVFGGEIVVNSSFGVYAHHWTHCGLPFKEFLLDLNFDYFMGKASPNYREFDFEASLQAIRDLVLEQRREGSVSKTDAATIWESLQDMAAEGPRGPDNFVRDLYAIDKLHRVTSEPYEYGRERASAQALGFWRELWPEFTAELRRELAAKTAPATRIEESLPS